MISWSPRLACASKQRVVAELLGELPELPITPDLVALLAAPAQRVASVVAEGLSRGAYTPGHRAVLVNLVARVHPGALPALVAALDHIDRGAPSIGLVFALADLARLRHHMLTELEPA
jgi:hypothetical protein